jgi:hypothetical protein
LIDLGIERLVKFQELGREVPGAIGISALVERRKTRHGRVPWMATLLDGEL